jgi:anti-sigma-K factor RskA
MSEHPHDDALAAHALGALDRDEAARVDRHVAGCARCREEVATYREVAGALGAAAPRAAMPAGLKERVLARAVTDLPATREHSTVRSVPDRAQAHRAWWTRPAAAAAALLVLTLGGLLANATTERRALENEVAVLAQRVEEGRTEIAARDSLLARVLGPEVETIALAATGAAPVMRLYWDRARGEIVVSAQRLPPAASGRTYQLWGIGANGTPVGLGTFNTSADGRAVVTLAVTADARFDVSAVTDEPSGGSPQPTTAPFLVGRWGASGT